MKLKKMVTNVLETAVERGELAGMSVLVRRDDEEVLYAHAGYADMASQTPIRRDSIFRLYSQSKPITAAAAMILADRGVIDLMEGVDTYLPGFRGCMVAMPDGTVKPALRAPWIMDLLGMTSGTCYPADDVAGAAATPLFLEQQRLIDEDSAMDTLTFCNRLGQLPLAFQPGEQFRYGTSADILGAVIEAAAGKRFGDFLEEELFEPLGMKDTAFWVPAEKQDRLVTVYSKTESGLVPWQGQHLAVGRYDQRPAFESGGAGLVSTLDDYAAFAQMLLNGGELNGERILSREAVRFMTQAQLMPRAQQTFWEGLNGYSYGKLMRVCTDPGRCASFARMGEYGWDGWLGSYFANFPDDQMTILMMTNKTDTGTCPTTRRVRNVILGHLK